MPTSFVIDCSDCVGDETRACDDCIVRYLVDRDESRPVSFDAETARAVRSLADAGLVPPVRLRAVS